MKKKSPLTLLQKINPINKDEEKRKFLFDTLYNPQFEYEEEVSLEEWTKYGPVSDQYLAPAKKIIDGVIQQWGSGDKYVEATEGKPLSQEEVQSFVQTYLKENGLDGEVNIQFSAKQVSRTLMHKNVLSMRLPVKYREHGIIGVLNHEVGTHYFRRVNEQQQPWLNKHRQFGFGENSDESAPWTGIYLETEEGLAVLNANIALPDKQLWQPALAYYAVYMAKELSFSALFKELKKYVEDREVRWTLCLKSKRGLRDTSLPGAFSKNQLYFSGAIKVASWLNRHNYLADDLYLGKLSIDDIELAKQSDDLAPLRLPQFVRDRAKYQAGIEAIISANKLETFIKKQ